MENLIYIADDEKNIRELLKTFLEEAGHTVKLFENGDELFNEFSSTAPDLVILDVMMPGTDGFSLCNKIRKSSDVPIFLLTARDTDADYITGFTSGCDDYFTKPFSPVKLTMRVNALMKRNAHQNHSTDEEILIFEDIKLNTFLKTCTINDYEIRLTNTEFEVMRYLISNKNRAVSRDEMLSNIWGYDAEVETRVTDDTVKRIRKKLRDSKSIVSIDTIWGFGFKLVRKEMP